MTTTDPKDGGSRVEREILEILDRAEASQTPVESFQAAVRRRRAAAQAQAARSTTPDWLRARLSSELVRLVAALALAVVASQLAGISHLLAVIVAIASAVAFFSLWVPMSPSRIGGKPRWRGQELDDDRPPFDFAMRRRPKPPRR